MPTSNYIPTVDLSPFFTTGDDEGKQKAKDMISQACSKYGFFQIMNHGVPLDLMNRAMVLSKTFFESSEQEKLKVSSVSGAHLAVGYIKQPEHSDNKEYSLTYPPEYLSMLPPGSAFNAFPSNPPDFREVLEELFTYFTKTCQLVETILTDCLGLPPNLLKEFNDNRSWDLMTALHYFQATDTGNNLGVFEHEDQNCITLVLQDEAGGLQILKNKEWIPVTPITGTLVVNIGDVLQVLSNNKFKSATHRVIRSKGRSRYSYAFFHNLQGDKWVEPLPQLTTEIGERPQYGGFLYKDYQALRKKNKTATKAEDVINITHFSIPT